MEGAFKVYDYGFNKLGFTKSHFDVMKNNEKVVKFHLRMGAVVINEDEDNFYFTISRKAVMQAWSDLRSFIK